MIRFSRVLFGFIDVYIKGVREFPLRPLHDRNMQLLRNIIWRDGYLLKMEREQCSESKRTVAGRVMGNGFFWLKRCSLLFGLMPDEVSDNGNVRGDEHLLQNTAQRDGQGEHDQFAHDRAVKHINMFGVHHTFSGTEGSTLWHAAKQVLPQPITFSSHVQPAEKRQKACSLPDQAQDMCSVI